MLPPCPPNQPARAHALSHAHVRARACRAGDRARGWQSLPVAFGVDAAKWICVASIDATQLAVAAYLAFGLHEPVYGAVLLALILPQARPPSTLHAASCPAWPPLYLARRGAATCPA